MLVFWFDGCRLAEVDLDPFSHYCFTVEDLADSDSGRLVEEGDNYAPEGFERCPRVNRRGGVDEIFDGLEIICAEDLGIL